MSEHMLPKTLYILNIIIVSTIISISASTLSCYYDSDNQYSIDFPKGWQVGMIEGHGFRYVTNNRAANATHPDGSEMSVVIAINDKPSFTANSYNSENMKLLANQLLNSLNVGDLQFRCESIKLSKLLGNKAVEMLISGVNVDCMLYQIQTIINNKVYVVSYSSSKELYHKHLIEFNYSLSTLSVNTSQKSSSATSLTESTVKKANKKQKPNLSTRKIVKKVYLKDGGFIECQKAWLQNSEVYLKINGEIRNFPSNEVDLKKTFGQK